MTRWSLRGLLVFVWLTLAAGPARADIDVPEPLMVRTACADAVFVGVVQEIENKTVKLAQGRNSKTLIEYQVLVVKVEKALAGLDGETHVRVAFVPLAGKYREFSFAPPDKGKRGCFFAHKHFEEALLIAEPFYDIINETDAAAFKKVMAAVEKLARARGTAKEMLSSKDAEERFLAVGMLLLQFRRTLRFHEPRFEKIDAALSKQILLALRDCDWNRPYDETHVNVPYLFNQLQLTAADGWKAPNFQAQQQWIDAAKKWLTDHADSYRLKRKVF